MFSVVRKDKIGDEYIHGSLNIPVTKNWRGNRLAWCKQE